MRTDLATMGVINPYALAEVVIGRRIDWSRVDNPHAVIETVLGMSWERLINPTSGSILYAGLIFGAGGPKWLPHSEVATDIEARLQAHQIFKPTTMPTQVSPLLHSLLSRSNDVALQQFRQAVHLSLGASSGNGSDSVTQWVVDGTFYTDPHQAEGGDAVQGALGDCYYISALDAVAWSAPKLIQWFPFVDPDHATQAPPNPTGPGSIRLSPGYYHSRDVGVPNAPVTTGPLWESVTMSEVLPENADGCLIYARSSRAGETWPNLYEKAFAIWRNGSGDQPNYTPLGGGDCGQATRVLVGRDWNLDGWTNESQKAADILQRIRHHTLDGKTIHPMTAYTYDGNVNDFPHDGITRDYTGSDIIPNHCYALLGWLPLNGVDYIVLRNPWGQDGTTRSDRAPDGPFGGLTLNTNGVFGLPIEVFRLYFEGVEVVYPEKGVDNLTWNGPEPLGDKVQAWKPGAVSWGVGRLDVFGVGTDRTLQHWWFDASASSGAINFAAQQESLGGKLKSGAVSAVSWGVGRLDVFGVGTDGTLQHWWFDANAAPAQINFAAQQESLGGNLKSGAVSAASWGVGRLDVFGTDADGTLQHWWSS